MANTKKIQEILMNSIFDVFEKMFFVFLEPLDEGVKYDLITSINFTGPVKGEIKAFFSTGMAKTMVQNMLGIEGKSISEKEMEDCAKEAVNMIGGSFLQKLDSSKVFDLSIPVFEKKSGIFLMPVDKTSESELKLAFDSEDNFLSVSMQISKAGN